MGKEKFSFATRLYASLYHGGRFAIIICMRILEKPITKSDLIKESENFIEENAIKAVVDVEKGLLAVDSPMHYDCEQLLLSEGSRQQDLWGINLYLDEEEIDDIVEFDSMINIRPSQNNRSRGVDDPEMRARVIEVVSKWLS